MRLSALAVVLEQRARACLLDLVSFTMLLPPISTKSCMSLPCLLTLALAASPFGTAPPAPTCNMSASADDVCAAFCSSQCSFYNTTSGEKGQPRNVTLYRVTPANVTGVANKNTADPPGDITFVISKKNLTQQCLHDPEGQGCHTDLQRIDLYGEFTVEVDGQWGPYSMCNPADSWDTADWFCGQYCMQPTQAGCGPVDPDVSSNGTGWMGFNCWCDRTARTVGRVEAPGATGIHSNMPPGYPPQCAGGFAPMGNATGQGQAACIDGGAGVAPARVIGPAWSFESAASMGCQACFDDPSCTGWRSLDNVTVELFHTPLRNVSAPGGASSCVGGARHRSHYGGSNWYGLVRMGGCGEHGCTNIWYSTPETAECAPGAPLGTDGCAWRLIETKQYVNATCVDKQADAAVEVHGKRCFDTCPQPLNRATDCYLDCYRNTLMGDAAQNLSAVDPDAMIAGWKTAFSENDPAKGGCPPVKPTVGPI